MINDEPSVIVVDILLNNAIKLNMAFKAVENLQQDQWQFGCHRIRCDSFTLYTVKFGNFSREFYFREKR